MKSSLKILLSILLFVSPLTSFAQWRFKAKVVSTSCHGDKITAAVTAGAVEGQCNHLNSIEFKTEKECNEARKDFLSWNKNKDCRIVVKASKCTCPCQKDSDSASSDKDDPEDSSPSSSEEVYYNNLHNKVDYKANAGYEQMMKTQPQGTERLKSGYIPRVKPVSSSDIVGVISKTRRNSSSTIKLLDEHAVPNTGQPVYYNFDAVFDSLKKYETERKERRKSIPDYRIWERLDNQLDDGQRAFIISMIRDKNGILPQYVGFKDDYYIFRSYDGKKIFKISPEGDAIFEYEFNDNFWNEDNIVKRIKDGTLKQYFEESFNVKYNETGKLKFNLDGWSDTSLRNNDPQSMAQKEKKEQVQELSQLVPQVTAELQMVLIDRSVTKTSRGYYIPESVDFPLPSSVSLPVVGSMGLPTSVNLVFGYSGSASSGRDITANASANATLTGVGASAGVKISDAELNGKVQQGAVITCGKKQYWVTFDVSGSIGAGASAGANASLSLDEGFGAKAQLGFPIYLGVGSKMVFKDISSTDEFDE